MGLLGFVAGGIGDAGQKVAAKAGDYLEKSTLQDEANAAQTLRETTLEGLRSTNRIAEHAANAAVDTAEAPKRAAATATAKGEADLALAPRFTDVEVERQKKVGEVKIAQEVEAFKALAPLKRQEALAADVEKVKAMSTPEMLAAARKIAQATHIVDPSYQLIPNADGTVTTFDAKSGKSGGVLKDADGKPIVRKDATEVTAASTLINNANTELKLAEAKYKVDATSLDEKVRSQAEVEWKAAQESARALKAPAIALLYRGAKIPDMKNDAPASSGPAKPTSAEEVKALPPGTEFINPSDGKVYRTKGAPAAGASKPAEEKTTMVPPGAPLPTDEINAKRRADRAAREAAEEEAARQKRLADIEATRQMSAGFNSRLAR